MIEPKEGALKGNYTINMERKKQAESSVLQEQEQLEQEQQARHHRQNPIAALIRRGAEEAGRQQGNSRAVTKVQRMINSLQWRQAHSKDEFYPLALESGIVLRFRQLQAGEVTGLGTGATVWPAAHVLAKYLERRFGERGMCGSRLVDLGSGTGVAGIVAAALGAEAYLTDQEQLLFLMRENAEMCARRREEEAVAGDEPAVMHPPSGAIHVLTYDWGMKDDDLSPPVDIILVSDCVLPKLYPIEPLVDAIDRLSGPDTVTIMSYEHRHYQAFDPRRKFEELAAARGLVKTEISQAQQHPIFSADDIEIWEVRRRRCDDPTSKDQSNTGGVAIRRAEEEAESSLAATLGVVICTSPPQCSLPADEEESPGTMKVVVEMLGERHELAQSPSGAIGCYLWPSAVVMARHIVAASVGGSTGSCSDGGGIAAPPYPARATVLELGSGVGLVAMAAALLGWKVVGTDKADAMPLLESNVTRCLSSTKREWNGGVDDV